MEIIIKEIEHKGFALAQIANEKAGEMTYSIPGDTFIIIDHTDVLTAFKGQGVGKALLDEIVKRCRSRQIKILPLCPFAKAQFDKYEEIRDVLKS